MVGSIRRQHRCIGADGQGECCQSQEQNQKASTHPVSLCASFLTSEGLIVWRKGCEGISPSSQMPKTKSRRREQIRRGDSMRVGELEDSVGKEFTSRRNEIASEAMRLPARLAEPVPGATRLAVPLLDSVHISPEARAAQFGFPGSPVLTSALPSPTEIVSILRDIEVAPGSPRSTAGIQRLVSLVAQVSEGLPGGIPGAPVTDSLAGALVRALLANTPEPAVISALVRELLNSSPQRASSGGAGAPAASRFEQVAVEILVAAAAANASDSLGTLQAAGRRGELPAALMSLLAESPKKSLPSRRRRLKRGDLDEDDDDATESGEPAPYLPDSPRT